MNEKYENAKLYLEKAKSKLETAKLNFEYKQFDDSVSRSYYTVFHSISGLLYLYQSPKVITQFICSKSIGTYFLYL